MPALPWLRSTLQSLTQKEHLDRDLDEELQAYLDLLVDEKVQQGMSPEAALREARIELGGTEQVKEHVRESRAGAALDTLVRDARLAFRTLRKNPGFTVVAILVLALGIGATTALFSTVSAALLTQIPFPDPDRLVAGFKTYAGVRAGPVSRVDYYDYRELSSSFEHLAAMADITMEQTLTGEGQAEIVESGFVTWNLFPSLGVAPVVGRPFMEDEEQGGAGVALISNEFWQGRLGGSKDVVDKTLRLDGDPTTIIGVMPEGFQVLLDVDLWRLVDREGPFDMQRDSHSHFLVGRLGPGVSLQQAQQEVDAISRSLEEQYPVSNEDKGLVLTGLHDAMVAKVRLSLLMLMATGVLVLLIASSNVAGLLLARGHRRLPEVATRIALGAPRWRLIRQLLTESVIVSLAAGLAGIGVAFGFQRFLLHALPIGELGIGSASIDQGALLFALFLSIATGLVVGVIPALRATAVDPTQYLKTGRQLSQDVRSSRLWGGLVIVQVAVSTLLLVGSALLISNLVKLITTDLGFESANLLTGSVSIPEAKYPSHAERNQFFVSLLEQIEAVPGVESASMINKLPILSPWQDWALWPAGQERPEHDNLQSPMARWVPPGYFRTMEMPLLQGRDITNADDRDSPRVLVITESVAQRMFPDRSPIGEAVIVGSTEWPPHEVIGVVADARVNQVFLGPDPAMYMAAYQLGPRQMQLAIRTTGNPLLLEEPISRIVREMDEDVVFADPATLQSIVDRSMAGFSVVTLSSGVFSAVALILAAIGLYGLLAHAVNQRLNEIGIRLAMGATRGNLLRMVLKRGLSLVGVGLVLGAVGALMVTLALERLPFEAQTVSVASYLGAFLVLAVVAASACFLPAWRATRVSPIDVLRQE